MELCLLHEPDRYDLMDYVAFFEQFALRVPAQVDGYESLNSSQNIVIKESDSEPEFDVFVSYSHQDKEIVDQICVQLDKYGISYWIDHQGEHHSDDFKEYIVDAICRSKILLFVSSYNSNDSRNTVKEVGVAEKNDKVILPVRIDDSSYNKSLEYDLCNRHWIQLKDPNGYDGLGEELNDNIRFYLNRKE